MKVTNKITIHLDDLRRIPPIDVMQGDAYTRELEFSLYSGGEAWNVPEGVSVAVAYRGASGHGLYDTLPNGTPAYTVSGNVVTVSLIPQVAAVKGETIVSAIFTDANGKQLATFAVTVRVACNPAIGAGKPEDYYNLREWIGAGPTRINVASNGDGVYTADANYTDILQPHDHGSVIICCLETADQAQLTLPFVKLEDGVFYFSTVCDGVEWLVAIGPHPEDDSAVVSVTSRKGAAAETTDEEYFEIDANGEIALKPEYRGTTATGASSTNCPKSISNNGVGYNGDYIADLPKHIVIPAKVGGIVVTRLADGMFMYNDAVESIVLPATITEIPNNFCRRATKLRSISGTENVRKMVKYAFAYTSLEKASFPNLEEMSGSGNFRDSPYLLTVDLGSKVTSIPALTFCECEKLHTLNAESVTSVGANAFKHTHRLNTPAFVPKLTSIGDYAFAFSRVDYDWSKLKGCTFGAYATSAQLNNTDWWSDCTYVECSTPMRSLFEQTDPRWADKQIGSTDRTYFDGCATVAAAHIYSAFEGKDLASPEEYVTAYTAVDPSLAGIDTGDTVLATQMQLGALGYTVDYYNEFNKENLQIMYDALASGKLVLCSMYAAKGVSASDDYYHSVVFHGIRVVDNGDGTTRAEVRIANSSSFTHIVGDYIPTQYTMPIQNVVDQTRFFNVVYKD